MIETSVHAAEQMADDELARAVEAHKANERRALLDGDIDAAGEHAAHRFLCLTILESRAHGRGDTDV